MNNIVLVQRILPHYRVPIFNKLGKEFGQGFQLIYGQKADGTFFSQKEDELSINAVRVQNKWLLGNKFVWQNIISVLKKIDEIDVVIVEHNLRYLSLIPLLVYLKIRDIPILLWGHGGSRKRPIHSNSPIDYLHRAIIKFSDGYICYNQGIKQSLNSILSEDKLFVASNTLDTETLVNLRIKQEAKGKEEIKKAKRIENKHVLLFIGRLIPEKRVDLFLDVLKELQAKGYDVGGIVIGDGPERNTLVVQSDEKNIDNVQFLGSIVDWEKSAPYLFLSDVLLIPGYVGLAVNHAFCFGLPVCTIESPPTTVNHAPEVEYIKDGKTGFKAKNITQLTKSVKAILKNQEEFSRACKEVADSTISIENMINGFLKAIETTVDE